MFPGVPFTFRVLAEAPEEADLSSLRLCFSAAAALPRSTFKAFHDRFGVPVRQLYGCTEAGCVTVNVDEDPHAHRRVGRAPRSNGVELRIVGRGRRAGRGRPDRRRADPQRRDDAGLRRARAERRGLPGRLVRARATAAGSTQEGRLFLTGRVKRLIDVRGDKVDPVEVEDVLAVHPKVGEVVVVVGVESDVPGEETVKAVVVPAGDCPRA